VYSTFNFLTPSFLRQISNKKEWSGIEGQTISSVIKKVNRTNDNETEDDIAFDGRALSAPFTAKTHRLPVARLHRQDIKIRPRIRVNIRSLNTKSHTHADDHESLFTLTSLGPNCWLKRSNKKFDARKDGDGDGDGIDADIFHTL